MMAGGHQMREVSFPQVRGVEISPTEVGPARLPRGPVHYQLPADAVFLFEVFGSLPL